jgi:Ca2+-binding EF-hand superfamily protein
MVSGEGTVDKFKLLFEAYDTDGSGTISAKEFMRIAHERGGHLDNNLSLVRNVLESLDADADGNVSFAEFRQAAAEMPLLLEAFHDLLPHAVLLEKHVADINASAGGPMDWQRLASMSKFLKQRGVAGQLDRGTFRALMHDFFGFDDPLLTTSMFDAIDRDGSGTVDFKELLGGLSAALRAPTPELKMDFYFSLYDQDQSGVIDRAEVFRSAAPTTPRESSTRTRRTRCWSSTALATSTWTATAASRTTTS